MIKKLSLLLVAWLCLSGQGTLSTLGAGPGTGTAPYQGPGDIVSGALAWGSCARVYNASLASTSTSLCDLVDTSAGTTAVCTLRGSASGFVDLTGTYCTGSTTPAAACAAAAGGACRVSKVYDQIGGGSGWTNGTNSQRPTLTFSLANGLPGLAGTGAANTSLTTSTTYTQAIPITWVHVAARTSNFTTTSYVGVSSGSYNGVIGFANSADTAAFGISPILTLGSVTDNSLHALQGVMDTSPSCVLSVDGAETSGNCGGTNLSSNTSRILRSAGGNSINGYWMEGGLWPSGFDSTQRTNMNANIHGTSGYNF